MNGGRAEVVFFRPRGRGAAARHYVIFVDGVEVGQLRNGGRLTTATDPGQHVLSARFGSVDYSNELTVQLAGGSSTCVKVNLRDPRTDPPGAATSPWRRQTLVLRVGDEGTERAVPLSAFRGTVGNRRSPREQVVYLAGVVALFAGPTAVRAVNRPTGLVVGFLGTAVVVAFFFRRLLFRKDDPTT